VVRPANCKYLNYEGEVAIVIGRTCRNVPPSEVAGYIAGYTIGNDGKLAQDGSTDEMQWDMHYLVADIARTITLCPGDVLLSGTPANSRPVQPGDVVDVAVDGLGQADQPYRGRPGPGFSRPRRPAHRERGSHLDRSRRRLGVPRHPGPARG
jgi:5-oxopent-3-ene-1,2,5-tricarboxylate decarboxylase/2-hydroxyhepta-2,4-diene-1,7-dioate isomerase